MSQPVTEARLAAIAKALDAAFFEALGMDAPVNERLTHYASALSASFPEFATAVDRLVLRLERAGAGSTAPKVGEPLPPFLLPDEDERLVSLADVLAKGPVAIAFHRGHWCPYCQINMRDLALAHARVARSGGQIVAITPERQAFTRRHKAEAGAGFSILSDIDNAYALSLGLAIWVGDEMVRVMSEYGRDLATYQGNPSWFLPIPATFVVARDGIIHARFVDPDYRRRMDVEALVEALGKAG
jgi:peroxiredoxin